MRGIFSPSVGLRYSSLVRESQGGGAGVGFRADFKAALRGETSSLAPLLGELSR